MKRKMEHIRKPDNNIPVYDSIDYEWDVHTSSYGVFHQGHAKLSDLIPTTNGTWTGCMWHGIIWKCSPLEGFIVEWGNGNHDLFIIDHRWNELDKWDDENPDATVEDWRYVCPTRKNLEIIIINDIEITPQKIYDVCIHGPISDVYEIPEELRPELPSDSQPDWDYLRRISILSDENNKYS